MTEKFSLKGFLIDLDGVLTAGDKLFQPAFDAVEEQRRREIQFRVITNTTIRDRRSWKTFAALGVRMLI